MAAGRLRGLDRQRQGAGRLAIREIPLGEHPRALRVGTHSQVELRGMIRKRQWMASEQPLIALSRARDLAPATRRVPGPDVQLSQQGERLGLVTRRHDALEPRDRGCHCAACNLELDAAVDCYGGFVAEQAPEGLPLKIRPIKSGILSQCVHRTRT